MRRAIFQLGTFIGSVIALAINLNKGKLHAVSTSTYVVRHFITFQIYIPSDTRCLKAFIIIIFIGIASAFLVLPPNRVVRADGTLVKLQKKSSVREEITGILALFKDWRMLGAYIFIDV